MSDRPAGNIRLTNIKRTSAQVKLDLGVNLSEDASPNPASEARVFLNELTERGVNFFAPEKLPIGKKIAITIDEPKQFFVKARIVGVWEYQASSTIITENPVRFRIEAQFEVDSDEQKKEIQEYCDFLKSDGLLNAA